MVLLTRFLGYASKLTRKFKSRRFIDSVHIHVKGGCGGSGLSQYGGIGGRGGNVYIVSEKHVTLDKVKSKVKNVNLQAGTGGDSTKKGIIGRCGTDLHINVPVGITVYDQYRVKLGEINSKGTQLMVAKGGIGGSKKTGYCGLSGESRSITLDLKLIADVGLVGFPNAGKSTFLSIVSRSRPKIASYPFTTIKPKIGTIKYRDSRQISIADLPGLIEGAHINRGMGHKFLKHIERTKLLVFIVDIQGFQISVQYEHRSCLETILLLNREIELYNPDLLEKPAIIIVNKMDTKDANKIYDEIKPKLNNLSEIVSEFDETLRPKKVIQFDDILATSLISKNIDEIREIKRKLRDTIDKYGEKSHLPQEDTDSTEDQLLTKLKHQLQRHTPLLL